GSLRNSPDCISQLLQKVRVPARDAEGPVERLISEARSLSQRGLGQRPPSVPLIQITNRRKLEEALCVRLRVSCQLSNLRQTGTDHGDWKPTLNRLVESRNESLELRLTEELNLV